jgi:hypothetical protein
MFRCFSTSTAQVILSVSSHERAQNPAMLYSLFAICSLHKVNPELWLTYLFENINSTTKDNLYVLLPQNYTEPLKEK